MYILREAERHTGGGALFSWFYAQEETTSDNARLDPSPDRLSIQGNTMLHAWGKANSTLEKGYWRNEGEIYSDLYCRQDSQVGGKLKVNYLCCISECPKPVVSTFVTSSGSVVFQKFSKHLTVHHEEFCLKLIVHSQRSRLNQQSVNFLSQSPPQLNRLLPQLNQSRDFRDAFRGLKSQRWEKSFYKL